MDSSWIYLQLTRVQIDKKMTFFEHFRKKNLKIEFILGCEQNKSADWLACFCKILSTCPNGQFFWETFEKLHFFRTLGKNCRQVC